MNANDLWPYMLRRGNSDAPRNGACTMDAVSWFAYGRLGDQPPCACRILTPFVSGGQDAMPDETRQLLKPYIFRLIGSRDPDAEQARLRFIVLAAARRFAPLAFDAADLGASAKRLRALPDYASFSEIFATAEAERALAAVRVLEGLPAWIAQVATEAAKATAQAALAAKVTDDANVTAMVVQTAAQMAPQMAVQAAARAAYASTIVWEAYIETLDGALALGRQGDFDLDLVPTRLREFEAVRTGSQ